MSKCSLWLTYRTCKNAKSKPRQKKINVCQLHNCPEHAHISAQRRKPPPSPLPPQSRSISKSMSFFISGGSSTMFLRVFLVSPSQRHRLAVSRYLLGLPQGSSEGLMEHETKTRLITVPGSWTICKYGDHHNVACSVPLLGGTPWKWCRTSAIYSSRLGEPYFTAAVRALWPVLPTDLITCCNRKACQLLLFPIYEN